jgi:hypothetical protein
MPLYRVDESGNFLPYEKTPFPDLERVLEDWIEKNPHLLLEGEKVALIARQPRTSHGKFLDLLGVDESGACIIIELKRGETPRDVVAQALEYAAWVDSLTLDEMDTFAHAYAAEHSLEAATVAGLYHATFVRGDDQEGLDKLVEHITFNSKQRIIIVAEHFSPEIEQTLRYLRTRLGVDITGLQFGVHRADNETIIQTTVVVGREATATAAAKTTMGSNAGPRATSPDEELLANVTTDFMRIAVTAIEEWIDSLGNPDLVVRHGRQSDHSIAFRGATIVFYYYAKQWLYCGLYNATTEEEQGLVSRLSKPQSVRRTSENYVRFHVATDADLEVLKNLVSTRVAAS